MFFPRYVVLVPRTRGSSNLLVHDLIDVPVLVAETHFVDFISYEIAECPYYYDDPDVHKCECERRPRLLAKRVRFVVEGYLALTIKDQ